MKKTINYILNKDGFASGIIYGRSRLGKTELIKHCFNNSKDYSVKINETVTINNINKCHIFNNWPTKYSNLKNILNHYHVRLGFLDMISISHNKKNLKLGIL